MPVTSSLPKIAFLLPGIKPKHHQFSIQMITTSLNLLNNTSIGRRTAVKILQLMADLFPYDQRVPCPNTLKNWQQKLTHAKLENAATHLAGDWVIIIDESISIGALKVLLILGVRRQTFSFNRPLCFDDCEVLASSISASPWSADKIINELTILRQSKGVRIDYMVSDHGPSLLKAGRDLRLTMVSDCSHAFANLLRRKFNNRADFQAFEKACTAMKRKGVISTYAHLLPPKHYAHSRFMNILPVVRWGQRALAWLQYHSDHYLIKPHLERLEWLREFAPLIEQLGAAIELSQNLCGALKDEGYHEAVHSWAYHQITNAQGVDIELKSQFYRYFKNLAKQCPKDHRLICSTDIAESYFARLKTKQAHTIAAESTRMILYQHKAENKQIMEVMERVKIRDIKNLKTVPTVSDKRKLLNKLVA